MVSINLLGIYIFICYIFYVLILLRYKTKELYDCIDPILLKKSNDYKFILDLKVRWNEPYGILFRIFFFLMSPLIFIKDSYPYK